MRSPRTAAALGAGLVLSLLLAGCSGSEDSDAGTPTASPTVVRTDELVGEPAIPLMSGDPCDSSVTVTGDVDQSWDVEGAVAVGDTGPKATYQSDDGATVLTVYAAGNGFERAIVLAVGLDSYASAPGAPGLRVAADGSAATVDTDATSKDGDTVHVTASFAC